MERRGTGNSAFESPAARPQPRQFSARVSGEVIQSDGIAARKEEDPPDCAYIPPGDHRSEEYRIATFARFPPTSPVLPLSLAKMGFYYTGFRDRVRCFSCGIKVEQWMVGDDVTMARWHRNDCLMIYSPGGDPANVRSQFLSLTLETWLPGLRRGYPGSTNICDVVSGIQDVNISRNQQRQRRFNYASMPDPEHERWVKSLDLRREDNRRKTFEKWPSYPAPYMPRALAQNGLFYLGNLDRTQCIFCTGVLRNWAPSENVAEQHAKHFSKCSFVTGAAALENVMMTEQARQAADEIDNARLRQQGLLTDRDAIVEPPDPPVQERLRLARLYPLNNPANPHMILYNQRLQTFRDGWPNRTRATIEEIAKAGFFFLGESDKTKCYFCNGGLQNWDRNDEPWTEHAKWFPGCAFIIRSKGQNFVRTQYEQHPNLNRPLIRNSVSYNLNLGEDVPPTIASEPNSSAPRPNASPPQLPTNLLESAMNMGFSIDLIQRVMRRKMDQDGVGFASWSLFLDALLHESNGEQRHTSSSNEAGVEEQHGAGKRPMDQPASSRMSDMKKTRTQSPTGPVENEATQEMKESLRVMQESSVCKNCKQNTIDIVCIPCGHLAICTECVPKVKRCLVCNTRINETMKIFRA